MPLCFFVSDLHGRESRYEKLFRKIEEDQPDLLFLGGDLFPSGNYKTSSKTAPAQDFVTDFLIGGFIRLKERLKDNYPRVFVILGNDDGKQDENRIIEAESSGVWQYIHNRKTRFDIYTVYGYAFVPPTPFMLKDWERYDVSRYVDPGCVPPEEGWHSYPVKKDDIIYATIKTDIDLLVKDDNMSNAIFLFHTPPYQTSLDRAALDGVMYEHVPLDLHVGSIAVKRFIEEKQPLITLHGHIHESPRLTGRWKEKLGRTYAYSAAHDGPELALVRFDPEKPAEASRELL
jgi:Icc-related predicted phosphoesterase